MFESPTVRAVVDTVHQGPGVARETRATLVSLRRAADETRMLAENLNMIIWAASTTAIIMILGPVVVRAVRGRL